MFVIQAEVLIWYRPRKSVSPLRPQPGSIVAVKPAGHVWGKAEGLPDFAVVKVHDIKATRLRFLPLPEKGLNNTIVRPHAHHVDITTRVPSLKLMELAMDGETELTKTEAQTYVRKYEDDGQVLSLTASLSRTATSAKLSIQKNVLRPAMRPIAAIRRKFQ